MLRVARVTGLCLLVGLGGCRSRGTSTAAPTSSASAVASSAAPSVPVANVTFHLVAKSERPFGLDALDHGALAYFDSAHDALLLDQHRIQRVHDRSVLRKSTGVLQTVTIEKTIDGQPFTATGASRDGKGRTFVSGFVTAPSSEQTLSVGGRVAGGVAVVQRWAPGASTPVIDRMPDPKSAQVTETTAAGVFSAGDVTFALFGASRSIAKFQDDRWAIEALPIGPECSEVRDFMLAKDGTIFFGTMGGLSCIGHSAYLRRGVDGRYEKLPLPDGVDISRLYAESANAIWITSGSALYFTEPLGAVATLP